MKTSYFQKPGMKTNPDAISIARWTPRWWGAGRRFIDLAPSVSLLNDYKSGQVRWWKYIQRYQSETLDRLDPATVYAALKGKVVVCWCGPDDAARCHRRLIAEWIEKSLGIEIPEV